MFFNIIIFILYFINLLFLLVLKIILDKYKNKFLGEILVMMVVYNNILCDRN